MKLFLSNAVSGEDTETVMVRMQEVVTILRNSGHEPYCAMFDSHKDELVVRGDKIEVFKYAFTNVADSDAMVAIVTSDKKSEGQLMEIGVLIEQSKPLYLFINAAVDASQSHLTDLARKTWVWNDDSELFSQLKELE